MSAHSLSVPRRTFIVGAGGLLVPGFAPRRAQAFPIILLSRHGVTGGGNGDTGGEPEPGTYQHGDSLIITGSGFGTKEGNHRYDRGNEGVSWSRMRPYEAASEYNLQSRAVGYRDVSGPHQHAAHYYAGCFQGSGANSGQSVDIQQAWSGSNFYIWMAGYHRYDPEWNFGGQDNNKFGGMSNGFDIYADPYVYVQYESGGFDGPTANPWINVYDPNGNFMSPSGPLWSSSAEGLNITQEWVYRTFFCRAGSSGFIRLWSNNVQKFSESVSLGASNGGIFGIGGYSGQRSNDNFAYFCDVYFDASANPRAVVLVQGSVWEMQKYTAWSDTSITIRICKGRLSSGEATVRILTDGSPVDLGTIQLA